MKDIYKECKKINIPNPFKCSSLLEFFDTFLEINNENSVFTHRKFADEIKWPLSLCANLAKGRKGLSVKRLLEFCRFSNFTSLEVDRMFYLLSREQFSTKTGNGEFVEDIYSIRYQDRKFTTEQYTSDILKVYIIKLVKWLGYIPETSKIKDLIYLLDFDVEEIESALDALKNSNVFQSDLGVVSIKNELLESDVELKASILHSDFGINYSEYCKKPQGLGTCNSGFVELTDIQVKQVEIKLLELRNWIVDLGKQNDSSSKGKTILYQADLNLFPVVLDRDGE
mgnify:CR=1 FL=1